MQTIRWLDGDGQEHSGNTGQHQLDLTIDSVGFEHDNITYICEVTVMLTTGLANLTENITLIVDGMPDTKYSNLYMMYVLTQVN